MKTRLARRGVLGGATAAGVALSVASLAYACTDMSGRMIITTAASSARSVAVANVTAAHQYCSLSGGAAAPSGGQVTITVSAVTALDSPCPVSRLSPSADPAGGPQWVPCDPLAPAPYTCTNGLFQYQAGIGSYEVRFQATNVYSVSGGTYSHSFFTNASCIDDPIGTTGAGYDVIGTMTVDQNGNGTWTGNISTGLSASSATDAGAICIRAERNTAVGTPNDAYSLIPGYYKYDQGDVRTQQAPIVVL